VNGLKFEVRSLEFSVRGSAFTFHFSKITVWDSECEVLVSVITDDIKI
jgi:hypothetical protein